MVGGHIADREPPTRTENPVKLVERALLVRESAQRAFAERGVERAIIERQRVGVALHEPDAVAEAGGIGTGLCRANRLGRVLEPGREAVELAPGEDRGGAGAGGNVEEPLTRAELDQLERAQRRSFPAGVKLAAEQPLDRGARVGDGAGLC